MMPMERKADGCGSLIRHFVINLEHSTGRRQFMQEQSDRLGLGVEFVSAVLGKGLANTVIRGYDAGKRRSGWCADLSLNEQGCMQSHLKALRCFLASDCEYGIVSEDDALFADDFKEKAECLVRNTEGWDYVKLWNDGPHEEVLPSGLEGFSLTFPKKIPWEATCVLYSRRGAGLVLKAFECFWLPFDEQLFVHSRMQGIIACSVYPCPVRPSDLALVSDIDHDSARRSAYCLKRSAGQWVAYRWHVWMSSLGKTCLKNRLKKVLARKKG